MINSKHTIEFCEHCDCDMVRCVTCGNNCCNGGHGQVNGKECPDCNEAYEHQHIFWMKNHGAIQIKFAKQIPRGQNKQF